jgi:hypothetical protein
VLQKERHRDQWNRIESLERNTSTYDQRIIDKVAKKRQWGIDKFFNKSCRKN